MQPIGADAAAFTIIGIRTPTGATLDPNAATTFPLLIGAQETYRVRVRFTPTEPNTPPYNDRSYQARFHIRNYESGDPSNSSRMSLPTFVVSVTLCPSRSRWRTI